MPLAAQFSKHTFHRIGMPIEPKVTGMGSVCRILAIRPEQRLALYIAQLTKSLSNKTLIG